MSTQSQESRASDGAAEAERLAAHDPPRPLSLYSFGAILILSLWIFFFLNPLFESRIEEVDANIWWSYAILPVLVPPALMLERKWRMGAFVLETMKLTFIKFAITYIVATGVWLIVGPPASSVEPTPEAGRQSGPAPFEPEAEAAAPRAISRIDPATTGQLAGEVRDASGAAIAGALVAIEGGLEEFVFALPASGVEIVNHGDRFAPPVAVVRAHQELTVHSGDGGMHTMHIADANGRTLLNFPVLRKVPRQVMFDDERGLHSLGCRVHGEGGERGHLYVVDHPFTAWTDAEGRFALEGIPAGEVRLFVWKAKAGMARAMASVTAGGRDELTLVLQ